MAKIITSGNKVAKRKTFRSQELRRELPTTVQPKVGLGDVVRGAGQVLNEFEENARDNELTAFNSRINAKRNEIFYGGGEDGQPGFNTLTGDAAIKNQKEHEERYQKYVDDEVAEMGFFSREKAELMGSNSKAEHKAQMDKRSGLEYDRFQDETFNDAIAQQYSNAQLRYNTFTLGEPGQTELDKSIENTNLLVGKFAKRKQLNSTQEEKLQKKAASGIYKNLVEQAQNNKNIGLATDIYQKAKASGLLNGETRAWLDKSMAIQNNEIKVEVNVDKYMADIESGKITGTQAVKDIQDNQTGEVERLMKSALFARQKERDWQKATDEQYTTSKLVTQLRAGGYKMNKLSVEDKIKLQENPKMAKKMEQFIKLRAGGQDIKTQQVYFSDLKSRLTNPATQNTALMENSMNYLLHLSDNDYDTIMKMKDSLRSKKDQSTWDNMSTNQQIINNQASKYGLKGDEKSLFVEHVRIQAELWGEDHKKKKIPNSELRSIIEQSQKDIVIDGFVFDTDTKVYKTGKGEGIPQAIKDEVAKQYPDSKGSRRRRLEISSFFYKKRLKANEATRKRQKVEAVEKTEHEEFVSQYGTLGDQKMNWFGGQVGTGKYSPKQQLIAKGKDMRKRTKAKKEALAKKNEVKSNKRGSNLITNAAD